MYICFKRHEVPVRRLIIIYYNRLPPFTLLIKLTEEKYNTDDWKFYYTYIDIFTHTHTHTYAHE